MNLKEIDDVNLSIESNWKIDLFEQIELNQIEVYFPWIGMSSEDGVVSWVAVCMDTGVVEVWQRNEVSDLSGGHHQEGRMRLDYVHRV